MRPLHIEEPTEFGRNLDQTVDFSACDRTRGENRSKRLACILTTTVWLLLVGCGFAAVMFERTTPGTQGAPPSMWPDDSGFDRNEERPTLLLFAHPRCPCTRATLNELAHILVQAPTCMPARVVFYRPDSSDPAWTDTDIVRQARRLTGATVEWDDDGRLARRFDVRTSGHVLLFDPHGQLVFSGGITAMRGHEGINAGRTTIVNYARGEPPATPCTPVFGCSLLGSCRLDSKSDVKCRNPNSPSR
jgi:hypothetical protein